MLGGQLQSQRSTTVDGESVVGPLAAERQCSGPDGGAKLVIAGVARPIPCAPGTHHELGAELFETFHHGLLGPGRDEHLEMPMGRFGDHPRGQSRVAAARNGKRGCLVPGGCTGALNDGQVNRDAHEVPRLVRPGDVMSLVLVVHPELRRLTVGRDGEAAAIYLGDAVIELANEITVVVVAEAARARSVPNPGESTKTDEGIAVPARRQGPYRRVEFEAKDVVYVVAGCGVGAGKGQRIRRGNLVATTRAENTWAASRHALLPTPVSRLSSWMRESQAAKCGRRPRQKS